MVLSNKRLREFSVSYSSVRQVKSNTSYPFIGKVTCELDLSKIAEFDHAGPIFSDGKNKAGNMVKGYRSNKTFQRASVVIMDCDNSTI